MGILQSREIYRVMHLNVCILRTGVAPIRKYRYVRNKNSNTQGSSPNVVKVISYTTQGTPLKGKNSLPLGANSFLLKRSSNLKRDIIVENQCLIQWSPFDICNCFSVLATPLLHSFEHVTKDTPILLKLCKHPNRHMTLKQHCINVGHDIAPTLIQHCFNVMCQLGYLIFQLTIKYGYCTEYI